MSGLWYRFRRSVQLGKGIATKPPDSNLAQLGIARSTSSVSLAPRALVFEYLIRTPVLPALQLANDEIYAGDDEAADASAAKHRRDSSAR